jgi:hypothetical protein
MSKTLLRNAGRQIMAEETRHDYIPAGDAEFLAWAKNFYTVCNENKTAWNLPIGPLGDLDTAIANFEGLYNKCQTDQRTKADTQYKNDLCKEAKKVCRAFAQEFLMHNSLITNYDLVRLGLHVRDPNKTPIGVPTKAPRISLERTKASRQLIVRVVDSETEKEAVPYGYNGAVIFYGTFDTPPAAGEDLPKSVLATTAIFLLDDFTAEDEGKRAYIAAQWENERGERGPWSDMQSMIVP